MSFRSFEGWGWWLESGHQTGALHNESDENDLDSSIFDDYSDLESFLGDSSQNWLYIEIDL